MERVSYYNENIKVDRKALKEVYEILNEYEEGNAEIDSMFTETIRISEQTKENANQER